MAVICSSNCGTIQNAPQAYSVCNIDKREFGFDHFFIIKCDTTWTDIKDATEWETKIAADEVRFSPPGILTFPSPTVSSTAATGSGKLIVQPIDYTLNYITYATDPNLADYTYWSDFFANQDSYEIGFVSKNQEFFLSDSYVAAVLASGAGAATVANENGGFEFSFSSPPIFEGDGKLFRWNTSIQITKTGTFRAAYLPGVFAKAA